MGKFVPKYSRYFRWQDAPRVFLRLLRATDKLEREALARLRELLGFRYLFLTANARSSLFALLQTLPDTKRVVVPAYTCEWVGRAVLRAGKEPSFVDIEPARFAWDASQVDSEAPAAISTLMYGHACSLPEAWREDSRAFLVEDAAHAFGSDALASFSRPRSAAVFSFGLGKVLSCIEGGLIATNDESCGEKIRAMPRPRPKFSAQLRYFAQYIALLFFHSPSFYRILSLLRSANGPANWAIRQESLGKVQLALLLGQLDRFKEEKSEREKLYRFYSEKFGDQKNLELPAWPERGFLSHFPIRVQNREALASAFQREGVEWIPAYPYSVPLLTEFSSFAHGKEFPEAAKAAREVICLPFYGGLSSAQQEKICRIVRSLT